VSVELARRNKWLIDYQTPTSYHAYCIRNVIYSGVTKYQQIDVVELFDFGKALILDGKIQSTLYDEYIYHECLVHPAMITHPRPRRVCIVGGGEGATAREVLRHGCVEEVVMIDIDEGVIEVAKKYLPEWHQGAFDDPRLKLVIADGRKYLEETNEKFDVVIMDVTDPLEGGPAALLYTKQFYEIVKSRLTEDGILVTQATSTHFSRYTFVTIYRTIAAVFPIVKAYSVFIWSFDAPWGFVIGSLKYDPLKLTVDDIERRLKERGVQGLRFYNPRMHFKLFELPTDVEEALEKLEVQVATDERPVFLPA